MIIIVDHITYESRISWTSSVQSRREKKFKNSSVQTKLVFAVVKNSKINVWNISLKEVGDWQSTFVEGFSLLLHLTRPKVLQSSIYFKTTAVFAYL